MPSYKTHDRIGIVGTIVLISGMLYYKFSTEMIILTSGLFLFSVFFLSPDLDINSKSYKRWKALKVLWYPYQKLMPHRGTSHNIIIGPFCPIAYLTVIIMAAMYVIEHYEDLGTIAFVILIVAAASELHIITDKIHSKISN